MSGRRHGGLGLLTALVTWAALVVVLFHPTTVGAVDNGDGERLTCQLGVVDPQPRTTLDSTRRALTLDYRAGRNPHGCQPYRSSALLVLAAGQRLSPGAGLDLRRVGAVWIALVGLLVGLVAAGLPGPTLLRLLTAAGLVVVVCDIAFAQFLVSVYSEPAELVGLLALLAVLLRAWRPAPARTATVVAAALALAVLATSKTGMAPATAGVALLVALTTRVGGRRVSGRLLPAALMAGVVIVCGLSATSEPRSFHVQHMYADVFHGLLLHSGDPQADLRALGQPPSLARYAGTTYFEPDNALQDPAWPRFARTMSFTTVLRFYGSHPARLLPSVGAALDAVASTRDPVANTALGAGRPRQVCRWCVLSDTGRRIAGRGSAVVPAAWLLSALTGLLLLLRRAEDDAFRPLARTLLALPGIGLAVVLTAVLGDGEMELVKHGFPAVVTTWLAVPLTVLGLGGLLSSRAWRRPPPRPAARR